MATLSTALDGNIPEAVAARAAPQPVPRKVLRESLKPFADTLRLSDVAPMAPAQAGEEVVPCNLADKAAVDSLVQGCQAIVSVGWVAAHPQSSSRQ